MSNLCLSETLNLAKAMNAKYGTRWLDTFLDETSFYYLDDPEAFAKIHDSVDTQLGLKA